MHTFYREVETFERGLVARYAEVLCDLRILVFLSNIEHTVCVRPKNILFIVIAIVIIAAMLYWILRQSFSHKDQLTDVVGLPLDTMNEITGDLNSTEAITDDGALFVIEVNAIKNSVESFYSGRALTKEEKERTENYNRLFALDLEIFAETLRGAPFSDSGLGKVEEVIIGGQKGYQFILSKCFVFELDGKYDEILPEGYVYSFVEDQKGNKYIFYHSKNSSVA